MINSLDALAHEFEHGRAYIQIHTDDGTHPENTGPGDLLTPGEIRGNIGPGDTDTTFAADINVDQMVLHGIDNTTPWDSVTSSGTVLFNTGHHSDHIDYTITADVDNVVGIHIHHAEPGVNSHIHLVDIIPTDTSTRIDLNSGSPLTGEIEIGDLCPGAHHDDDGHGQISIDNSFMDIFGYSLDSTDNPFTVVNALGNGPLTLSADSPVLILTDDSILNEILIDHGVDATLDLSNNDSTTMGDNTTVVIPSDLVIKASVNTVNEVHVEFPAGLEITGDGHNFNGVLTLLSVREESGTNSCLLSFPETASRISSCVEIGVPGVELTLSQPVKITFPGEGSNTPYYGTILNSDRILVTNQCDDVNIPEVNGLIVSSSGPVRECYIQTGGNMVIWTSHMTSFGTISSASSGGSGSGSGSGGGGGWRSNLVAPNLIMYNSCSDDSDGVLRILAVAKQGNDLSIEVYNDDFRTKAVDVTEDISYLKYVDRPSSSNNYEYFVFDARFPNDLNSFWIRLYVNDDPLKGLGHLVTLPKKSCVGYEEPFPLKDSDASILKPIEPLETSAQSDIYSTNLDSLAAAMDPEPAVAAAAMDPEPAVAAAAMDPEPAVAAAAMDPEPAVAAAAMDPEPAVAAAAMDPEPAVAAAAMDPEPAATIQFGQSVSSSTMNSKCGPGTILVNNVCQVTETQNTVNLQNMPKQIGMFEQFLRWLGLA